MKFKKTMLSILLTLSILSSYGNTDTTKEYDYVIQIDIASSKEKVWNVLTNFKDYSKWNTVLKMQNNDNMELGKEFDVSIFENDGSLADSFQAIAVHKTKYESFSASQTIFTKSFFKATHHFIIEEVSNNEVIFIQKWELEGVIAYLFESMIFDLLDLFVRMNLELKIEVENS
ncbi:MAG: hypothetical protein ACI9TV_000361 [Sulfurimonas sp.]|jgi:hypothetical protein|uniref:SRPBCC domain-containing protein n=1 Tax=Sulfurimonas sp. TaxID=2022749 RepID=UPI0039E4CA37